jgi:hypothetical protein
MQTYTDMVCIMSEVVREAYVVHAVAALSSTTMLTA